MENIKAEKCHFWSYNLRLAKESIGSMSILLYSCWRWGGWRWSILKREEFSAWHSHKLIILRRNFTGLKEINDFYKLCKFSSYSFSSFSPSRPLLRLFIFFYYWILSTLSDEYYEKPKWKILNISFRNRINEIDFGIHTNYSYFRIYLLFYIPRFKKFFTKLPRFEWL